jgi:hypothetical protein
MTANVARVGARAIHAIQQVRDAPLTEFTLPPLTSQDGADVTVQSARKEQFKLANGAVAGSNRKTVEVKDGGRFTFSNGVIIDVGPARMLLDGSNPHYEMDVCVFPSPRKPRPSSEAPQRPQLEHGRPVVQISVPPGAQGRYQVGFQIIRGEKMEFTNDPVFGNKKRHIRVNGVMFLLFPSGLIVRIGSSRTIIDRSNADSGVKIQVFSAAADAPATTAKGADAPVQAHRPALAN